MQVLDPQVVAGIDIERFNSIGKTHAFVKSPMFERLERKLNLLVDESLSEMRRCISSDPNMSHLLKIRYQQRFAMAAEILAEFKNESTEYEEILKSLNPQEDEENVHD